MIAIGNSSNNIYMPRISYDLAQAPAAFVQGRDLESAACTCELSTNSRQAALAHARGSLLDAAAASTDRGNAKSAFQRDFQGAGGYLKDLNGGLGELLGGVEFPGQQAAQQGKLQQSDVRELQRFLKQQGYDVGAAGTDGLYGQDTHAALQQYLSKQKGESGGRDSGGRDAGAPARSGQDSEANDLANGNAVGATLLAKGTGAALGMGSRFLGKGAQGLKVLQSGLRAESAGYLAASTPGASTEAAARGANLLNKVGNGSWRAGELALDASKMAGKVGMDGVAKRLSSFSYKAMSAGDGQISKAMKISGGIATSSPLLDRASTVANVGAKGAGVAAEGLSFGSKALGALSKAAPVIAVGAAGLEVANIVTDDNLSHEQKIEKTSGAVGSAAGAWVLAGQGAAMGASLGLMGGPFAAITVPAGAIVGGIAGGVVGSKVGREVGEAVGNAYNWVVGN